jgi:hypothetical protein
MSEIHDIIDVEVAGEYALRVTFDDGAVREVNVEGQLDGPSSNRCGTPRCSPR